MTRNPVKYLLTFCSISLTVGVLAADAEAWDAVKAAQAYRIHGEAVQPAPDGTIFCESEEFQVEQPGWKAQPWGENYYAATFANCFLSRKAFLGAPEQCARETIASVTVAVKDPGSYLVLARYEAAYRFETRFRVKIEQQDKVVFDQVYGARDNMKIWAFGSKLKQEVAWPWGAVENVVWEGYLGKGMNHYAELQPGPAKIFLIAGSQPNPGARRNVDLLMLTRDEAQVENRVEKEGYLPLDGWLTQAGDVFMRVTNTGTTTASVKEDGWGEHSPYWVHMRTWKPGAVEVNPGKTSDWVDLGGGMDTLNDGQWGVTASGPCTIEFGARNADGTITRIRQYENINGKLNLIGYADVRYSHLVRTRQEGIDDLLQYLNAIPMQGKTPTQTMIVAGTGIREIDDLFGTNGRYMTGPHLGTDLRGKTADELDVWAKGLTDEQRAAYLYISLGDEIGSGAGLKPLTDALRKYLPNAGIGANYSPHAGPRHAFLGEVKAWVTTFRDDAMTMPWGEDYIWQLPMGTPQMNSINLDLFRAGIRGKPNAKIMYYVMPHMPGNIPPMWRRMFYSAMGHGAKLFNLFEFQPVWMAYTENHCTRKDMYGSILRTLREYGTFEDIVQSGQVRPSQVALWFSETADTYKDYADSGGAAKRALYIALLGQQLPLDFLVEQDAASGAIDQYKVLYLTDRHVSRAASEKIADWVKKGGRLLTTAGAGMFDETGVPNTTLRELIGVTLQEMMAPRESSIGYIKEDLPFAKPVESLILQDGNKETIPVFGAISRITAAPDATVLGSFSDKSPAITWRKAGAGEVIYCAFMPGLSYFKPAIPVKPLDRGTSQDAMAHFLPTEFDRRIGTLLYRIVPGELRPVTMSAPLVEATVIESKVGTAITLTNWTTTPVQRLKVTANIPLPTKSAVLSTGKPVTVETVNGKTVFTLDLDVADTLVLR